MSDSNSDTVIAEVTRLPDLKLPWLKWSKMRCAGCRRPARVSGFWHCWFTKMSFGRESKAEYDLFLCAECGLGYMHKPWATPYFSKLGRLDKTTLMFQVTYT